MKFSIIVPIYNVAPYLRECLNSIADAIEQCKSKNVECKVEDVEVVCVDDGSTDGSSAMLDESAEKFKVRGLRFYVIHQGNRGVGAARNRGLEEAIGDYIWFVDGDDLVWEKSLVKLSKIIDEFNEPDIIEFQYDKFYEKPTHISDNAKPQFYDLTRKSDLRASYKQHATWLVACSALYKRSTVSEMRFERLTNGEDSLWGMRAYYRARSMVYTTDKMYGYRMRLNGANHNRPGVMYASFRKAFWKIFKEGMRVSGIRFLVFRRFLSHINTVVSYWRLSRSTVLWLRPFKRGNYQFFREWAAEAWESSGGRIAADWKIPLKVRFLLGKFGLVRPLPEFLRSKNKMIVAATGRVEYYAWPTCYRHELVPIVWDCWPKYWPHLVKFVKTNRVKTIFCTSRQTADMVREQCSGVNAVWLPEGIKTLLYPMGPKLKDRRNEVMKFGRDVGGKLLYPTLSDLTFGLRDSKVLICRPRCDTNPETAGNVETLTQRYWEGMLSGCLIVGRAPQELIDFCGYNPVLGEMPERPEDYQYLVDKNRKFAEAHADWRERIAVIKRELGV